MSTVFDDNSSSLKLEKLNLYWNKYGFLRKRIYYDILFLFKKFESDENINFLIINSFNEKTGTGKLLKLIKIIELLNNKKIIKITRGSWYFNKIKRRISNKTILDDLNKLYDSIAFQFTRKNF